MTLVFLTCLLNLNTKFTLIEDIILAHFDVLYKNSALNLKIRDVSYPQNICSFSSPRFSLIALANQQTVS